VKAGKASKPVGEWGTSVRHREEGELDAWKRSGNTICRMRIGKNKEYKEMKRRKIKVE
jgi:hypothetical protein